MSTVLVIEDDPEMRELERRALTYAGHDVLLAENGQEALRTLETHRPTVIVLDGVMRGRDGRTFRLGRAKRGVGVEVPVVCVSGAGPAAAGEALHLGAA